MTEKRFVYYEHKGADYILDTPNFELDFIEMLGDALEPEEIVEKLNELSQLNYNLTENAREYQKIARTVYKQNKQLQKENNELQNEVEEYNLDAMNYQTLYEQQLGINKELKQSNKDAWNLIRFIYNEIKEDGYMDWGRIQDLVEFET